MLLQSRPRSLARGIIPRVPVPVAVVAGSLLLGFLSLLLPSAPTYDPFAWIIWGREVFNLDLSTVDGPSWKPLPVVVTTLTAPLGEASVHIWVAVARAGGIAAVFLAWILGRRLAGPIAGLAAAVGLAVMPWWIRNVALGNSEGLMVAFVFGALLCHMEGRRGWAFTLALGAAMLRPEAWPFLGLYALWLLYEDRSRLSWLAGGLLTLPVLWLGPELWGSGNAFRASDRAQQPNPNSPAFADDPALEVMKNAIQLPPDAATIGAVVAVVLGLLALRSSRRGLPSRREALGVLGLAAVAIAWMGLVAAMTSNGFSGNTRYLIVPAALLIVVGGVGIAWLARAVAGAHLAVTALFALAVTATFAGPSVPDLKATFSGIGYQERLYDDLRTLVEDAGGAERIKACGHAYTGPFLVPHVAWQLQVHTTRVGLDPQAPAAVFHVRTHRRGGIAPPLSARRPNVLARRGQWMLSADCKAAQ